MRFKGYWSHGGDDYVRRLIVKLHSLPPEIRELETYERCYTNSMFVDRGLAWDRDYDQLGNLIPQSMRKPVFQDPLGKEIIDNLSALVFGGDKFPSIAIKVTKDVYPDVDLIQEAIDNGDMKEDDKPTKPAELKRLKVTLCNEQLQKLASGILTSALLNLPMLEATRMALVMGRSIVVMKLIEGVFYLEVINYKNVRNLQMDPHRPDVIQSFSEMYLYEDVDDRDRSRRRNYWFRRDFTDAEEITYQPIPENEQKGLPETFTWTKDAKLSIKHDLGFCPAVLFEAPLGRSVFYGQVENLQAYVYLTNNLYTGLRQNMNPQYAVLFDEEGGLDPNNMAPKRRSEIIAFTGAKSFSVMAPGTAGYETALKLRDSLKGDIMRALRLSNHSMTKDNEASGTALTIKQSPTIEAAGEYQICFGDRGMQKVCEMILKTAILYNNRGKAILVRNDAMIPTESMDKAHFIVSLDFGPSQPVTEEMILAAVTNALTVYKGGLCDLEHAVKYIAPYFNVIDTEDMIKKIRDQMEQMMGGEDAKQMYGRIVHETNKGNKALQAKGGGGGPVKPNDNPTLPPGPTK